MPWASAAQVLATGGSGRLHVQGFMTTHHYGATGDGLVLGYRAGVPVSFLHTVQYHPTGLPGTGILITEACEGTPLKPFLTTWLARQPRVSAARDGVELADLLDAARADALDHAGDALHDPGEIRLRRGGDQRPAVGVAHLVGDAR